MLNEKTFLQLLDPHFAGFYSDVSAASWKVKTFAKLFIEHKDLIGRLVAFNLEFASQKGGLFARKGDRPAFGLQGVLRWFNNPKIEKQAW